MASPNDPTSLPSPELIAYSNAGHLVAQAATLCAIALSTVLLRCYARVAVLKSFGYDDWTMLLAMVINPTTRAAFSLTNLVPVDGDGNTRVHNSGSSLRTWEIPLRHSDGSGEISETAQGPICSPDHLQRCSHCGEDIRLPFLAEVCDKESISAVLARLERFFDGLHADVYRNTR